MSNNIYRKYEDRLKTLKRRRDFLEGRIADYHGKDSSRDRAEASAINWAISVIEAHYQLAADIIEMEGASRES